MKTLVLVFFILLSLQLIASESVQALDQQVSSMVKTKCGAWKLGRKNIMLLTKFQHQGESFWKIETRRKVSRRQFTRYVLDDDYYAGNDAKIIHRALNAANFRGMKIGNYILLHLRAGVTEATLRLNQRTIKIEGLSKHLFEAANLELSTHKRTRFWRCR